MHTSNSSLFVESQMRILFISIIIISIILSISNTAESIILEEVIDEAIKNNPEILEYEKKTELVKTKIPLVSWLSDPTFGIGYEENMRMYKISQMIPFPRKLSLKKSLIEKETEIANAQYEKKRLAVISEVKSAYYQMYLVYKTIEIKKEEKDLLLKFEKIAESKYSVGQIPLHDVLKTQVELAFLSDEVTTLENEKLPTVEAKLNALLNRPIDSSPGIPEEFTIPEIGFSQEEIEELALKNRPELKSAIYSIEKMKISHNLAKMDYYPDFMIDLTREDMISSNNSNYKIMVGFNLPLWFWVKKSKIEGASLKEKIAVASYNTIKNKVLYEVRALYAKVKTSERRVKLFHTTIIPLAEESLSSASMAYQTGTIDFLSLINSLNRLIDAKLKYYETLVNHGEKFAELERVVGIDLNKQG